ncbi:MAG: sugar ABC transporter ATP-binding protein [Tepidanaerobacteraceae bacterium]|jgi:ribose transport system ATP-binding protein
MDYVLELENVSKEFPGVKALSNVSLSIKKGEVHALVGGNGAGKSTLMKILSGAYKKDSGKILFEGKEVKIDSPRAAENLGISIIYQELNLIQRLSVAENIFLGRQQRKKGIIQWKAMFQDAERLFEKIGIHIDVREKVGHLSVAQQQMVEIAKAISHNAKVVIMDEPTSSLTTQETEILFTIIKRLKSQGSSVIFITHRIDEIFTISDRLSVLRDGCYIGTKEITETSKQELVSMIIGRELKQQYPPRDVKIGEECLRVEGISDGRKVKDVSFVVRKGEVVGFAGLVGSGRTETMRLIFGADKKKTGKVYLHGKEISIKSPKDCIRAKIGFVTEDRKGEGLLLSLSCKFNMTLVAKEKIKKNGLLNMKIENQYAREYVDSMRIVTPSINQKVVLLSGGNQQKVVVAKWLFSDSEVIIMDEPTRGIDVGAKREIYEIINRLAAEGKAIIVVSSEMEEIMGISDRILVMREGNLIGEVMKSDFSQQKISEYAIGGINR